MGHILTEALTVSHWQLYFLPFVVVLFNLSVALPQILPVSKSSSHWHPDIVLHSLSYLWAGREWTFQKIKHLTKKHPEYAHPKRSLIICCFGNVWVHFCRYTPHICYSSGACCWQRHHMSCQLICVLTPRICSLPLTSTYTVLVNTIPVSLSRVCNRNLAHFDSYHCSK